MPEDDWAERRACEAFIERLFDELEESSWGLIDWDGADRDDFLGAIRSAWAPKR